MSSCKPSVLIVRINSEVEITNTSTAVDIVREQFEGCPLITISAPNSEALHLLLADKRFEKVHIVDPAAISKPTHLVRILKTIGPIRATVIFRDFTPGQNYDRHVLTGLVFGGAKYIIDKDLKLNRLISPASIHTILSAAKQKACAAAGTAILLKRYPRVDVDRQDVEPSIRKGDNILAVRLDRIGDVMAVLPVIQAVSLETGRPVDILVQKSIALLLEGIPFLGVIHTFSGEHISATDPKTNTLVQRLRGFHYDTAIELAGNSLTARLLCRLSGSKFVIGLAEPNDDPRQGLAYLDRRVLAYVVGSESYTARAERIAESFGLHAEVTPFRFEISDRSRARVADCLKTCGIQRPYAALHVRASSEIKTWKIECFVEVADHLAEKHNMDVVLTGSAEDTSVNELVRQRVGFPDHVINIAGQVALADLPALYDSAQIIVSVDTGPAHIAGATASPLVVIGYYAPYGRDSSLIMPSATSEGFDKQHPYHSIIARDVADAIDQTLKIR
jgi:ADP-heptose:LPS heptosyltransferase